MVLTRRALLRGGAGALIGSSVLIADACSAPGGGKAPTTSEKLQPFRRSPRSGPRTGLPNRVAWANTTPIGIFAALGAGISLAAGDTDLEYVTADAEGDPQANVQQIETFLARGVGGLTIQPLDPAAQTPVMQQALDAGSCVMGIITSPCTIQVATDQYRIGLQQGRAAAAYITGHLGGHATVFNANLSEIAPELARRNRGVLDGLAEAGSGVEVIDRYVSPADQTRDRVFQIMTTAVQQNPGINVVLGVDGFVLPAYRAFEQTGMLTDDLYFAGVDGDPEALSLVAQGGPYRTSHAFAWTLMGYGMGRFAADWVAGRTVPRLIVAKPTLVDSPETAHEFLAAADDPRATYEDHAHYARYLPLLGNVSYAERTTTWTASYEL